MLYQLATSFSEGNSQVASINPELCKAAGINMQTQSFNEDENLKQQI